MDLLESAIISNAFIFVFLGLCLIGAWVVFQRKVGPLLQGKVEFPYQSAGPLMTEAEKSFFQVLELALPANRYRIFGKVRVEDIINVRPGIDSSKRMAYRNKINRKHVDILVVDKSSFDPIFAIELDDKSHEKRSRVDRDKFLDGAFLAAGIKLFRFSAKKAYKVSDILQALGFAEDVAFSASSVNNDVSCVQGGSGYVGSDGSDDQEYLCPKCYAPMVRRRVKSGKYSGSVIIACSRFPDCRKFVPLDRAGDLPKRLPSH